MRAAIRPDNSPQLYLPDRFRDETTELADGTIVMLDEYNRPVRLKSGRISLGKAPVAPDASDGSNIDEGGQAVDILQVQETLPETVPETSPEVLDRQEQQKVIATEEPVMAGDAPEHVESQEQLPPKEEHVEVPVQPQPAPWEVRSEDLPGEQPGETPDEAGKKPISRAERRRMIKEEIQRLSQGEQPIYYQRRLW